MTSSSRSNRYDVFISFKGQDTSRSFTDHLYAALVRNGIFAFREGDGPIEPALFRAIEASQIFIVVFSKNYASSTRCLRELEKILESNRVHGKCILPVYYDVAPSEVRKQTGGYGESLAAHEEKFQHDLVTVQRWRKALIDIADFSGCELRDKPQYAEIGKIVEQIRYILNRKFSTVANDLVGMDYPIEELEKSPKTDIMDVLRLSFTGLEEEEKEIFLHIACFFNQGEKDYVKNVLNCCGFHPDIGLRVLVGKSLISISDESKVEMHDLFEKLGRKIVHENSRKWSRLWLHEQFYNVVLENMENNVDSVVLYGSEGEKGKLMAKALSKMNHLRLLILKDVKISGSLYYLSNKLRYVEWDEYPFLYLPSSFQPNQLVELILVDSSIKQLWEGKKYLPNLRTLDLSYSENLTKMPYFGEFPNLERLNLEGCVKLVQMDSSISLLRKLVFLNLKNCENLICIPNEIFGLTSLQYLNLCGRSNASSCVLPSLPSFSCLSELDISFCSLSQIPDAFGCLTWLERLNLRGNNFVTLPSLRDLSKLEYLNLEHCKRLTCLPEFPSPVAIKQDKHKRAGMYIFNCPELGEREHYSKMTLSWMKNFIQANQDSSASFHQIDIVIPGSEILSWFNNREMGGSISIDPSTIVYDNNIIGIACCAVFSVEPFDPTMTRYEWGPVIRLGFKRSNVANNNYAVIPVALYRHLVTVKSNHTWLIYFDRELFFSFVGSIDSALWELDHIKMEASTTNGQGLHLDIKNCGYRWVFKQDEQPFESLNNDTLRKEESHKFTSATLLAIDDEAQPQSQAQ